MLPTSPPSEPPNQGSQSEANTPEDRPARRGGLGKFFRNLFYLSRATEAEVARQAQDRVKSRIEKIKIEEELEKELKSHKKRITNEVKEIMNKTKDEIKNKENDVKKFAKEKKKEIDKLREKLNGRINGLIYLLGLLVLIIFSFSPLIPRIIQDFSSIKTLETQIKYLESDIEDLQDDRDTS